MSSTTVATYEEIELPTRRRNKPLDHGGEPTMISNLNQLHHDPETEDTARLKIVKTLVFQRPAVTPNWSVIEATNHSQSPVYFATVYPIKCWKPDIVLHTGANSDGEVVSVSYFRFSRHVRFSIGDPALVPDNIVWEDMKNMCWCVFGMGKYEFELDVPIDDEDAPMTFSFEPGDRVATTRRRKFAWRRTHDTKDGVEGWTGKLSLKNFRLVDMESKKVVAVFIVKCLSYMQIGELRFHQKVSKEMEIATVMTCASINEILRRRDH